MGHSQSTDQLLKKKHRPAGVTRGPGNQGESDPFSFGGIVSTLGNVSFIYILPSAPKCIYYCLVISSNVDRKQCSLKLQAVSKV
jgi:hypothetical protein